MLDLYPEKNDFIRQAYTGRIPPVFAEIPFCEPASVYERLGTGTGFLFESIKGPEKTARYSFAGVEPFLVFKTKNGRASLSGCLEQRVESRHPLKLLGELLQRYTAAPVQGLPPFTGGIAGLISYDFVHYLERLPVTVTDDLQIPEAHFFFIDLVIAFDHILKKAYIIASPGARRMIASGGGDMGDPSELYKNAQHRIIRIYEKITGTPAGHGAGGAARSPAGPIHINHEMGKYRYMEIVRRAKEYIRAGDIFQANLSQRVSAEIGDIHPWQIYRTLSGINPSPFAAYLEMGDYQIVSSSPERLVRVSAGIVETRPIAGTRPRGADAEGDRLMRSDLLLNEKERAEHIMLIDLERNDLGRISDYGTVRVDEMMITEDYSHVIHIVSNVRGELLKGKNAFDVIRATFPGGTITGVPKVRCMEIIDELEPVARGPYTGSVGYISFSGDMDLNIIIRTFVIKDGIAYVQAGAGIVADSDPEREYYETLKKAEALIRTLERL
jgi:anthranilate/para-aminobenzoate synthase component I